MFSVLNVNCALNAICKPVGNKCTENSECCSNDCKLMVSFFKYFSGYCNEPQQFLYDLYNESVPIDCNHIIYTNSIPTKNNFFYLLTIIVDFLLNTCAYFKENDTKIRDELFKKFNINAAHGTLRPNSLTEVLYNNKTAYVTISDRKPRINGTYLELSEAAAKELGIEEEGLVKCQIIIPYTIKELLCTYSKLAVFFLPFISLILIIRFYS